jgi:general secretion pathway protein D
MKRFRSIPLLMPVWALLFALLAATGFGRTSHAAEQLISAIDFRNITVGDALRILADQSGLNIIASKDAAEIRTALFLRNVRPMEVLDALSRMHNLWYQKDPDSGIVRVYTTREFKLGDVDATNEETKIFTLKYPYALEIAYAIRDLYGERVEFAPGSDQAEIAADLQGRFRRFNIVDSQRTQGFGSGGGGAQQNQQLFQNNQTLQGSGNGLFQSGPRVSRPAVGDSSEQKTRREAAQNWAANRMEEAIVSGEDLRQQLKIARETGSRSLLEEEIQRRMSRIFVSVLRSQNKVLVRTRDHEALEHIRALVDELDQELSTLMLEVKILSVDLSDGFDSVFNFDITAGDLALSVLPGARAIDAALLSTFVNKKFNAKIQILEREGRVTSVATPMLLTTNQEVSRIFLGEERPVTTGYDASTNTSNQLTGGLLTSTAVQPILVPRTELRSVGTTLLLTPNINADGTVSIRILVEQSTLGAKATIPLAVTNQQNQSQIQDALVDVVNSRTFSGTVVAKDNSPVAIGGLIDEQASENEKKVPILGDIPLLGALFRDTGKQRARRELIVILTPHVMKTPGEAATVSREVIEHESIHPNAPQMGGALDIYSNPGRQHDRYKLEDQYKFYDSQDDLDEYRRPPRSRPKRPPESPDDVVTKRPFAGAAPERPEETYAQLTRVAAEAMREPGITDLPPGIYRTELAGRKPLPLMTNRDIEASPVAGWEKDGIHVTAVYLQNLAPSRRSLDHDQLHGRWLAATFESEQLARAGTSGDGTYAYLISAEPFHEALRH